LVKGLVEWHQAAYYIVNPADPFSNPWYQLGNHDILGSTQYKELIRSPGVIMDERALGFLRFTAASAHFDLEAKDLNSNGNYPEECRELVECHIRAYAGKIVGTISVPISWLEAHSDKRAEFILLSKHMHNHDAENGTNKRVSEEADPRYPDGKGRKGTRRVGRCSSQSKYYIMLIDWKEGPHCVVAVRIGITLIDRDDWVAAEATSKLIVLD
jgi:hypothetical protein